MAVQPLNKSKIIKKIKKHPNRFQSDKYLRVPVSPISSLSMTTLTCMNVAILEKAQRYRFQNQKKVQR